MSLLAKAHMLRYSYSYARKEPVLRFNASVLPASTEIRRDMHYDKDRMDTGRRRNLIVVCKRS